MRASAHCDEWGPGSGEPLPSVSGIGKASTGSYYNGSQWVEDTRGYMHLTTGTHSNVMLSAMIAGTAVKINGSVYNSQVTFYD